MTGVQTCALPICLIRGPVKIFLPLGFALLTAQGVSEVIKRIAMLTGHMKADSHYERPLQ